MRKKWWLIVIIAIVVIIIAVPAVILINLHNSLYNCGFQYEKVDNIVTEMARRHVYYNAGDKTVEVEVSQDLINSLIKDNFADLNLNLPKNVTIKDIMFNTLDQRLYVNAKYGRLDIPVSFKIIADFTDDGVTLNATDINLGNNKAPGIVKKQFSEETLKYSIKYDDFDVPRVFSVKDVKYGLGMLEVIIQLDVDKICDLAMDYRKDLVNEIDNYKNDKSGIISTFIDKLLGSDVLSESKVKDYVRQTLDNEELVNSAINFAVCDNPQKYSEELEKVQQTVMDWMEPLQVIQYYGNVDNTVEKILYDEKLKNLLSWFLPEETLTEYTGTVEEYYGMYKDYYSLYEDVLSSIDKFAAGIDTKSINKYVDFILEYTSQTEDGREFLLEQLDLLNTKDIKDVITSLENDKGPAGEYIRSIDPDYYNPVRDYLVDLDANMPDFIDYVKDADLSVAKDFGDVIDGRRDFILNVVSRLKSKKYEDAFNKISSDGVIDKKTKAFADKYKKQLDLSMLDEYISD